MINIERRVYNMVVKHDTCNPFIIAKERKINIDTYLLPKSIRACYTTILRRRHIGLSSLLSESGRAIALSHELGHDKLHRGGTFNCSILEPRQCIKYRPELEANLFALNLLSYARDFDVDIIKKFLKQKNHSSKEVHSILKSIFEFHL